jgi:hypothetical protein
MRIVRTERAAVINAQRLRAAPPGLVLVREPDQLGIECAHP